MMSEIQTTCNQIIDFLFLPVVNKEKKFLKVALI